MVVSEPVLVVVALGTLAFLLAATKIMGAATARAMELHFVQVRANTLRNNYNRQVMALRAEPRIEPASPVRWDGDSGAGGSEELAEVAEAA